ncbi:MAG: hypothetical protein HOP34_15895 [Methylococcaceae bacterium]|nr:hypothetical protein [Methylococcaceae bacterium]
MTHHRLLAQHWLSVFLITCSCPTWADSVWSYQQKTDSLNNQSYTLAKSPLPQPGMYDDIMLSLVCKAHKLQAVVEADDLISSQNSNFKLEYQIDQQAPVALTFKTFPDSKRKGYTEEFAAPLAADLMVGKTVFIRINTLLRTVLSNAIPLDLAAKTLQQVLADCAVDKAAAETVYGLAAFQQDLSQLTPEQQQQVWVQVRAIMRAVKP